jgi:hypothetical protein
MPFEAFVDMKSPSTSMSTHKPASSKVASVFLESR